MTDVITQHLNVWTSAIASKATAGRGSSDKQTAYGIKKLRELILELAVRGKLVPQDQNDEPASVLLKKVCMEKGEAKKEKSLPDIDEGEMPFQLPAQWEWVRFGHIAQHNSGKTLDRGRNTGELRDYITTSNLYWGRFDLNNIRQMLIADDELEKCTAKKGDLLICEGGEAGRAAVWNYEQDVCFQNHVHRARFYGDIDPYFAYRFFEKLNATGEIDQHRKGVGISNMSSKALALIVMPLPPLTEQHRIVAKVDELMALCDQLEQQQSDHLAAHQTLVQTLLDTLIQAAVATEFEQAWSRIADHFDTLFTTEASIDQLKQTLLQLAVMGKLVPQDPNDMPAKNTLQKIISEKELLIKAKKFQNTAKLKPKNNSLIFPKNWEYVQVGEMCPSIVPNRDKPKSFSGSIPWVTLASFPENGFYLDHSSIKLGLTQDEVEMYSARLIPKNTVLMSCVGRFGLTAINKVPVVPNQQIHGFVVLEGLIPEFLSIVIRVAANQLDDIATTTTIAYLNKTNCESIEFGLPPTAEQHRIVAKVDELMTLCDALKTRIATAQTTQLQLADAIVEQAVA